MREQITSSNILEQDYKNIYDIDLQIVEEPANPDIRYNMSGRCTLVQCRTTQVSVCGSCNTCHVTCRSRAC